MTLTYRSISSLLMDGTTLFMLAGIMMATTVMRKRGRRDDYLFSRLLMLNGVVAFSDILVYLCEDNKSGISSIIGTIALTVYFATITIFCVEFLQYVDARFHHGRSMLKGKWTKLRIPAFIMIGLYVINPVTGLLFRYENPTTVYHYGPVYAVQYVVMAFYLFYSLYLMFVFNRQYAHAEIVHVWLYFIPMLACMVVPFILRGVSMAAIGILSAIVFTHIGSMHEAIGISVSLQHTGGTEHD